MDIDAFYDSRVRAGQSHPKHTKKHERSPGADCSQCVEYSCRGVSSGEKIN
jgi:hypothetical protein